MAQAAPADSHEDLETSKLIECVSHGSLRDLKSLKTKKTDLHTVYADGTSLVHYAVLNPKPDVLEYLLESGLPLEASDDQGRTPLHVCAKEGTLKNMQVLIANGANIRATDKKGATALHYAAERENSTQMDEGTSVRDQEEKESIHNAVSNAETVEMVELLLKKGLSIEALDELERTPLHHCCMSGSLDIIQTLIDKGASINAKALHGWTALQFSAQNKKTSEIVDFLLRQGMPINTQDKFGYTALHHSVTFNNMNNMKVLVEKGADVNPKGKEGASPLHLATAYGTTEMMQYLLEKGASIKAKNSEGITPLLLCAGEGNAAKMKLLVEKGADILERAEDDVSSLHFAAANKKTTDTMQYLLHNGMPIELEDKFGRTPLLFSAANGNLTNVEFLCEKGANLNALCKDKATALHFAASNAEGGPIIKYLLSKGIPVDVRDGKGKTPLFTSVWCGIAANERILLAKGANGDELDPVGSGASLVAMLEAMMNQQKL